MRGLGRRSAFQRKAPFALGHIVATGQSLGAGFRSTPTSTTQPFNNRMLFDPTNTYPGSGAFLPGLQLVPLVSPQRAIVGGPYPTNIHGETPDIAFANQLTALARAARFVDFPLSTTCVSRDAAAMNAINKEGGFGNEYADSVYETSEILHVFNASGMRAICSLLTHGETDSDSFTSNYGALVAQMQSDYQTDLSAVTGQSTPVPLVFSQQNQEPTSLFGPNFSAAQTLATAQANPLSIVMAGPKYQFPFADGLHMGDYRGLGELCAWAFWQHWLYLTYGWGAPWAPLWPTGITRNGTTVTITFNVPVAPLVWESSRAGPHILSLGSGLSLWAPGQGFETWDATQTVSAASGTPIVLAVPSTGNFQNGDTVLVEGILGNTNANGAKANVTIGGGAITLPGTTSNGAFSAGGGGATVKRLIGINSATIVGRTVQVVLARTPTVGGKIGYAETPDTAYAGAGGGYNFNGRCGLLRDSSRFLGRSGIATASNGSNANYCVEFTLAIP